MKPNQYLWAQAKERLVVAVTGLGYSAELAELMARELGMSYSSLYAKLKALTGETPKAYATAYRMNIARNLLLSGEWTVSEVADKVGSSSPFTFSREFKNHFGYPPSQAKKQ